MYLARFSTYRSTCRLCRMPFSRFWTHRSTSHTYLARFSTHRSTCRSTTRSLRGKRRRTLSILRASTLEHPMHNCALVHQRIQGDRKSSHHCPGASSTRSCTGERSGSCGESLRAEAEGEKLSAWCESKVGSARVFTAHRRPRLGARVVMPTGAVQRRGHEDGDGCSEGGHRCNLNRLALGERHCHECCNEERGAACQRETRTVNRLAPDRQAGTSSRTRGIASLDLAR